MIQEFEVGDADDIRAQRALAREQLGMEIPFRSAGAYTSPKNPWPREKEDKQGTLRLLCRKGNYNGDGKGKETAGISVETLPQQLLKKAARRHAV